MTLVTPQGAITSPYGDILAALTACVCKRYDALGIPLCDCRMRHHEQFLIPDGCDGACCPKGRDGVLMSRVVEIRPYLLDGDPGARPCANVAVEVEMAFAIYRCVALTEDGTAPPAEQEGAEAHAFLADATIMRHALSCCADIFDDNHPGDGFKSRLGNWTPKTQAGCAGGEQRLILTGRERLGKLSYHQLAQRI